MSAWRCRRCPTLAQTFRDAGYQAYAVGKMHVYPQRNRIGFDDVILNEEGRHHLGAGADDFELFLAEQITRSSRNRIKKNQIEKVKSPGRK